MKIGAIWHILPDRFICGSGRFFQAFRTCSELIPVMQPQMAFGAILPTPNDKITGTQHPKHTPTPAPPATGAWHPHRAEMTPPTHKLGRSETWRGAGDLQLSVGTPTKQTKAGDKRGARMRPTDSTTARYDLILCIHMGCNSI